MRLQFTENQRRMLNRLLDENGIAKAPDEIRPWTGDRSCAPLSFGQERLFYFDQLHPGSAAYHVCGALRLCGALDTDALQAAVHQLVVRHEVLRTGFTDGAGAPHQVVYSSEQSRVDIHQSDIDSDRVRDRVAELARTGFDLARPPLVRAELLRLRDSERPEWVLVLCVHHIVVDGWSLGLLIDELSETYAALHADRPPRLPELTVQYVDFAVWQRERLTEAILADQLNFWREELVDLPAGDLPTDRPRPARRSYAGDVVPFRVPPQVVSSLRGVADGIRATLFMVLLSALSVVLGRWANTPDVVIGTPLAGRQRSEFERVAGFFVNTIPLRIRFDDNQSFRELLANIREICTRAYTHQDVPFEQIINELQPDRDESGQTSLARHWIVLHNTQPPKFQLPDLECAVEPALVGSVRCDLSFQLVPCAEGGLDGWLEFSTELFDPPTAHRLATAFLTVLAAVAADPDVVVAELPVMPAEVLDELLRLSTIEIPVRQGAPDIAGRFEAHRDAAPDATAVIEPSGPITYRELEERANRVAHLLRARGIGVEDRVGVCLEGGADLAAALLGIYKVGAAYLPIHPGYPQARLTQLIAEGEPRLVITSAEPAGLFADHSVAVLPDDVEQYPVDRPPRAVPPVDATAYCLFTSGSTGRPKGVLGTYRGLLNRLDGMQQEYRITADDRVLQKAPIGFDVSLWEMLWPLTQGASAVSVRPGGHRDPDHLHEVVERHQVTVCHFVPSMWQEFVSGPTHACLRLLLSGGERTTVDLAEHILERYPDAVLYNQYGPTEAAIDVTAGRISAPSKDGVPIGRPVPGSRVHVLDDRLRPQPAGVPGELYIGGPQLARGYFDQPGQTADRFVPDPYAATPGERLYATGDRARLSPDGAIEFLGRSDSQVKISGNRVETGEVEAVLRNHPDVVRALVAVRAESEPVRLVAYVSGSTALTGPGLSRYLAERLPGPMVPAHVVVLDEWPLGPHNKVDTNALPDPEGWRAPVDDHVGPRNPLEQKVADIFSELLQREQVDVHDSFLELGGHSLLAIRAIARIRAACDVSLRIGEFFQAPDVASVARLIERRKPEPHVATAPIPRIDRS
ncbi:non-ribosomal peptide synthetase [Nocardiopsis ansamitocini]|uniref:Non-ribosomal peptide synthetase n=1 Tax=Nocardiopsis ansamitocini TaxID=1670832 RepID=A0A9W6PAV6_9ACTN|nr:amino acid adenylation domain-containing protein [Nocardiopsis ansamitocini]GLU50152.1 non-ribosomal peptide synthetase [Nocardiopsis ansamitocini]